MPEPPLQRTEQDMYSSPSAQAERCKLLPATSTNLLMIWHHVRLVAGDEFGGLPGICIGNPSKIQEVDPIRLAIKRKKKRFLRSQPPVGNILGRFYRSVVSGCVTASRVAIL